MALAIGREIFKPGMDYLKSIIWLNAYLYSSDGIMACSFVYGSEVPFSQMGF